MPARAADTYDFGLVMPMTGSNAAFGLDQVRAAMIAVDEINSGFAKRAGFTIKADTEDSQADPRVGVQAFNKVTSVAGVPIVITAWSSVIYALAPLANREKVLLMSVGANDPKIPTLGEYVISSYPLANVDITALANYLAKEKGHKKAAVIYINNATGEYASKVFMSIFKKAGGTITAVQTHEPNATDYTAQLTNIRASNPDLVHIHSLTQELPLIVKQARQLGITAQLSSYSSAESQLVLSEDGPLANGLIYTALVGAYDQPNVKAFIGTLTSALGRAPNGTPYCLYLHDAPTIVAQCVEYLRKKNRPYNGENLRRAITEIREFQTPLTGTTIFNPNGSVVKPVGIKMIQDGKFVFITSIRPNTALLPNDQLQNPFA